MGRHRWAGGVFEWLVRIRPSHLVYMSGDTCYLEPYVPSRFARQFGYDQLYVGNPNLDLAFMGSLIDGARAWRFFTARGTGARLRTPLRNPNLQMTLCFCQWYTCRRSSPLTHASHSIIDMAIKAHEYVCNVWHVCKYNIINLYLHTLSILKHICINTNLTPP